MTAATPAHLLLAARLTTLGFSPASHPLDNQVQLWQLGDTLAILALDPTRPDYDAYIERVERVLVPFEAVFAAGRAAGADEAAERVTCLMDEYDANEALAHPAGTTRLSLDLLARAVTAARPPTGAEVPA